MGDLEVVVNDSVNAVIKTLKPYVKTLGYPGVLNVWANVMYQLERGVMDEGKNQKPGYDTGHCQGRGLEEDDRG